MLHVYISHISRCGWSLRFGGLLNATSGGLRMACLSLSEVWRIDKHLFVIPLSLVGRGGMQLPGASGPLVIYVGGAAVFLLKEFWPPSGFEGL